MILGGALPGAQIIRAEGERVKRAVMAVGLCLVAGRAHGAMLPHHDLASLVLLSDFIVLVDQFEKETEPGGSKVAWCRVTKTYKGSLLPGVEFARPRLDSYSIDPSFHWDREALFFLTRIRGRKDTWDPLAPAMVPSGVRLFRNGAVYRFYQMQNPGGYVPISEKGPDERSGVRLGDFEKNLEQSILRVAALEKAQTITDSSQRTQALLNILGPSLPQRVFEDLDFYEADSDVFTAKVLERIEARRDLEAILDGYSRCSSCEYFKSNYLSRPKAVDLLGAARDATRPVLHRTTALRMMCGISSSPRAEQYADLTDLLKAREPEIRRGAARVIDRILTGHGVDKERENEERRPLLQALLEAWKVEVDPLARTVLFSAGSPEFFVQAAGSVPGHPIRLEGCVSDGTAYYVHAFVDGRDRAASGTVVVAVPAQGGPAHRSLRLGYDGGVRADGRDGTLTPEQLKRRREIRMRSYGVDTGFKRVNARYIGFDPPLPPGTYTMWIEGRYSAKDDPTLPQDQPELVLTTLPVEVAVEPE